MNSSRPCSAELQAIAVQLRASLGEGLSPDQAAYAALVKDGELHPWTEQAEAIWTRGSGSELRHDHQLSIVQQRSKTIGARTCDPWHDHHLAILHHAKAYDLETAGSRDAFQYWTAALRHWAAVHADDAFWARMTRHLSERMGTEIDPSVIAQVRTRLPRELLEPHRDLIAAYRRSDPERAKSHMRVMTSAPFHSDVIDGIRLQFTEEVLAAVPDAVMTAEFDGMITDLRGWQHIDPDNAHVLRSLLYVYRKANEQVWDADDGLTDVSRNIAAAKLILQTIGLSPPDPAGAASYLDRLTALRPGGLPPGALAAEIARHEVWSGLVSYQVASQRFSWEADPRTRLECEQGAAGTVKHFALARQLDPHLALDHYYAALPMIEASVESLWGLCRLARKDHVEAAQHCRRATTLDPSNAEYFLGLAQALLLPDNVTYHVLTEAEQAISRAEELRGDVGTLRRLLMLRRSQSFRR